MRLLPGLICLIPLLSPLAHAELIDDVNDRGELRIALEANTPPFNFKEGDTLTGFEVELGQLLARELDVRADFIVTDADRFTITGEEGRAAPPHGAGAGADRNEAGSECAGGVGDTVSEG